MHLFSTIWQTIIHTWTFPDYLGAIGAVIGVISLIFGLIALFLGGDSINFFIVAIAGIILFAAMSIMSLIMGYEPGLLKLILSYHTALETSPLLVRFFSPLFP